MELADAAAPVGAPEEAMAAEPAAEMADAAPATEPVVRLADAAPAAEPVVNLADAAAPAGAPGLGENINSRSHSSASSSDSA